MSSKTTKESIVHKLGFKSNGAKSMEAEMDRLKKENAQLKKSVEELSKRNGKPSVRPDSDKTKLLERILSLETLREKNAQQLLANEQEVLALRQQVLAKGGEVVASLQNQLDRKRQEAERRENLFQALSQETEDLKNNLVAITEKCNALQKHCTDEQVPSGDIAILQEQLQDALKKNQHWVVYDQQREAYVQGVLARVVQLEQQLHQAKQTLEDQHKDSNSDGQTDASTQQELQDQLQSNQRDLQLERERLNCVQAELKALQTRHEEKCHELVRLQEELQEERKDSWQALTEDRRLNKERETRLQNELEAANDRLEEERKRANELLLQVNLLQKSILSQREDQKKIAVLEQQIQLSDKDFENEKLDHQILQQQLHKVLKELRKARDQITRLESAKQRENRFSEPSSYNRQSPTSPAKCSSTLDESFLECPNCMASYPTSQHRELLVHLDYCFS